VYFAFILVAQARVRVDAIDIRLALPGSLALVLAAVTFVCGSVRVPRVLGAMVASALLIGAIAPQASTARAIAKVGAIPPHDALRVLHRSPVLAWLEANATANDLIIAEDGLDFPFYLGPLHIAFFSEAQHPDQFLEYADTREYLVRSNSFERYERVWLVLQNRNGVETGMHPDDVFRADLVSGRLSAYPDVTLVETLEDALIFEWRAAPI
jgi:hypothetical protein